MTTESAHGVSLPLFFKLQQLPDIPSQALSELSVLLTELGLEDHICLIVDENGVLLTPETKHGREVLQQLKTRSEFLPCSDDACEYGSDASCRWCRRLKK